MYIKGSVEAYLNDLAAKRPAPGGGSAAALQAATGAALMSMVDSWVICVSICMSIFYSVL